MDNRDIDRFFAENGLDRHHEKVERDPVCVWTFGAAGTPAFIQTQESANRMRIVAHIQAGRLQAEHLVRMLQANYTSALDARYALSDEGPVACFLHPLRELTQGEFVSALHQVLTAARTFGRDYRSGSLVFGPGAGGGAFGDDAAPLLDEVVRAIGG